MPVALLGLAIGPAAAACVALHTALALDKQWPSAATLSVLVHMAGVPTESWGRCAMAGSGRLRAALGLHFAARGAGARGQPVVGTRAALHGAAAGLGLWRVALPASHQRRCMHRRARFDASGLLCFCRGDWGPRPR